MHTEYNKCVSGLWSKRGNLIKSLLLVVILITVLPPAYGAVTNAFTNKQVTMDFYNNMTSGYFEDTGIGLELRLRATNQLYIERFALNYSTDGGDSYVFKGTNNWTLSPGGTSWYGINTDIPSYMLTDSINAKVVRADLATDDNNIAVNVSAALRNINNPPNYRWLILTYIFNNTNTSTTMSNVRFFFGSNFDAGGAADAANNYAQYIAAHKLLYIGDTTTTFRGLLLTLTPPVDGFSSTVIPSGYYIYTNTSNGNWDEVVYGNPSGTNLNVNSNELGLADIYIAYRWSLGNLPPGKLTRIPIIYAWGSDTGTGLTNLETQITNATDEMADTNIVLSSFPSIVNVYVNNTANSTISVDNTQPLMDYANLTVQGIYASDGSPVNWNHNLSHNLVFLNPYTNYNTSLIRNVTLNVSVPWNASGGLYNVTVLGKSIFNSSKYSIINVTLNVTDNIPPSIYFVPPTPANNLILNTNYTFINITLSEIGSTAILDWNNTNYTMNGGGTNFYYNTSLTSVGLYSYRVYANDTSNNWNSTEVRVVRIDYVPPNVTMINPSNDSIINGSVYINATISDDYIGVANASVNISNSTSSYIYPLSLYNGTFYNGNWSYTWDTTGFNDGVYMLRVNATDNANNTNVSEYVTTKISNYFPVVTFINPTPANNSVTDNSWIFVNTSINEPDIKALLRWDNTSEGGSITNLTMNCTYTYCYYNETLNSSSYYAGNYSFKVWANDSAGNLNFTEWRDVTVKGRLKISGYQSLAPKNVTAPSFNTTMLKFNISALGENITLSSIKLKKTGNYPYTIVNVSLYWDKSGNTTTSLQSDDVLVGGPANFDSSGYATLPLNFRENLSQTETFVVVYDIGKL